MILLGTVVLGLALAVVGTALVAWDRLDTSPPTRGVGRDEAVARIRPDMDMNLPGPKTVSAPRPARFCHLFPESCLTNHDWVWVVEAEPDPPDGSRHFFAADYLTGQSAGHATDGAGWSVAR